MPICPSIEGEMGMMGGGINLFEPSEDDSDWFYDILKNINYQPKEEDKN